MRLRVAASSSMPAALALARALRVTPREALALLAEPRVLPAEFDAATAQSTCVALRALGVEASTADVPPMASRCADHPSLTGDGPCRECRTLVCPLCLPNCRSCCARLASATRWKHVRVAVLLIVFLSLASWAFLRQRRLDSRNAWLRTVRVWVVLVSPEPVEENVSATWRTGLAELDEWFSSEAQRVGLPLEHPVHFELSPTTVLAKPPQPPQKTGKWLEDSKEAIKLRSTLTSLAGQGKPLGNFDVQLIVALRPPVDGAHLVEGLGEAGGVVGLVEGTLGETSITLESVAVAHELLHCLGARDGYDEEGHADPNNLVEPELGFPQRFADVMVGEVPLGPRAGRIPTSLDEVRINAATAREIGWPSP